MKRTLSAMALACVALSLAATVGSSGDKQKDNSKDPDSAFFRKAVNSNMAEVVLGKLALTRSTNDQVKKFANHMIEDHNKAVKELVMIGKNSNVTPIQETSKMQKQALDDLGQRRGADFDRAYMKNQVKAHEDAVKLFKDEAANGKNKDFKSFAAKTLPTIQEHLKMAKELSQTLVTTNK